MTGIEVLAIAVVGILMLGFSHLAYVIGLRNGKLKASNNMYEDVSQDQARQALKQANRALESIDNLEGAIIEHDNDFGTFHNNINGIKEAITGMAKALDNQIEVIEEMAQSHVNSISVQEDLAEKIDQLSVWAHSVDTAFENIYTFQTAAKETLDNLEWVEEEVDTVYTHAAPVAPGSTQMAPVPAEVPAEAAPAVPQAPAGVDGLEPDDVPLVEARTSDDAPMITDLRAEPFREAPPIPASAGGGDPYALNTNIPGVEEFQHGKTSSHDPRNNPIGRLGRPF